MNPYANQQCPILMPEESRFGGRHGFTPAVASQDVLKQNYKGTMFNGDHLRRFS